MFFDKIQVLHEDTIYNNNGYIFIIKSNDNGDIPHIHVVYDKNSKIDTCLDLEYNCYGNHKSKMNEGAHRPFPRTKYLKEVLDIMSSPLTEKEYNLNLYKYHISFKNYWELAKFHWNRSDSRHTKCLTTECPYNFNTFIPKNRND